MFSESRKLVALVSLAYAFCLSVGQAADRRTPIACKKPGYRATSRSRHGLNILRHITRPAADATLPIARQVEALLRWLIWQMTRYQDATKIVG